MDVEWDEPLWLASAPPPDDRCVSLEDLADSLLEEADGEGAREALAVYADDHCTGALLELLGDTLLGKELALLAEGFLAEQVVETECLDLLAGALVAEHSEALRRDRLRAALEELRRGPPSPAAVTAVAEAHDPTLDGDLVLDTAVVVALGDALLAHGDPSVAAVLCAAAPAWATEPAVASALFGRAASAAARWALPAGERGGAGDALWVRGLSQLARLAATSAGTAPADAREAAEGVLALTAALCLVAHYHLVEATTPAVDELFAALDAPGPRAAVTGAAPAERGALLLSFAALLAALELRTAAVPHGAAPTDPAARERWAALTRAAITATLESADSALVLDGVQFAELCGLVHRLLLTPSAPLGVVILERVGTPPPTAVTAGLCDALLRRPAGGRSLPAALHIACQWAAQGVFPVATRPLLVNRAGAYLADHPEFLLAGGGPSLAMLGVLAENLAPTTPELHPRAARLCDIAADAIAHNVAPPAGVLALLVRLAVASGDESPALPRRFLLAALAVPHLDSGSCALALTGLSAIGAVEEWLATSTAAGALAAGLYDPECPALLDALSAALDGSPLAPAGQVAALQGWLASLLLKRLHEALGAQDSNTAAPLCRALLALVSGSQGAQTRVSNPKRHGFLSALAAERHAASPFPRLLKFAAGEAGPAGTAQLLALRTAHALLAWAVRQDKHLAQPAVDHTAAALAADDYALLLQLAGAAAVPGEQWCTALSWLVGLATSAGPLQLFGGKNGAWPVPREGQDGAGPLVKVDGLDQVLDAEQDPVPTRGAIYLLALTLGRAFPDGPLRKTEFARESLRDPPEHLQYSRRIATLLDGSNPSLLAGLRVSTELLGFAATALHQCLAERTTQLFSCLGSQDNRIATAAAALLRTLSQHEPFVTASLVPQVPELLARTVG